MRKILVATAATLAAATVYSKRQGKEPVIVSDIAKKEFVVKQLVDKNYSIAVKKSLQTFQQHINELGLPGAVVGVSVDGEVVWVQAFGMANVETQTPCDIGTKMRIASISKPITTSLLAKLKESGMVDLDLPIQTYVSYFPVKTVNGKAVTITSRLLACHKSGVRHYPNANPTDVKSSEFYLKDRFKTVEDSVALFSKDDLLFAPDEKFEYTTHGYTLLSAVMEGAAKTKFEKLFREHLNLLGLFNTHLDEIAPLIYNRASYYRRNSKGRLVNAELTDNSYKWAGGGLVSDVQDLLKFANIMLYSYQQTGQGRPGFLTAASVRELWTPIADRPDSWSPKCGYGLGWTIVPQEEGWIRGNVRNRFHVGHSGAAVGASSVLLIFPLDQPQIQSQPSGISIAIITNLESAGLYKVAKEIVNYFIEAQQTAN